MSSLDKMSRFSYASGNANLPYVVIQVTLKEKLFGTGSGNLTDLENVINEQVAKGYRLHTMSTSNGGSKGLSGGDRIQATLVFERLDFAFGPQINDSKPEHWNDEKKEENESRITHTDILPESLEDFCLKIRDVDSAMTIKKIWFSAGFDKQDASITKMINDAAEIERFYGKETAKNAINEIRRLLDRLK